MEENKVNIIENTHIYTRIIESHGFFFLKEDNSFIKVYDILSNSDCKFRVAVDVISETGRTYFTWRVGKRISIEELRECLDKIAAYVQEGFLETTDEEFTHTRYSKDPNTDSWVEEIGTIVYERVAGMY